MPDRLGLPLRRNGGCVRRAAEGEKLDKVKHLRRAAEHLAAAEKAELAKLVAREALLEEKLEQIRKLQADVAELRQTTAIEQPLTVHVKIMELQLSKMRKLGFDFQTVDGIGLERMAGGMTVKPRVIDGLISALRQHDLVKMLAEPTLVTVSGRPATFHSGGEFPIVTPQSLGGEAVEYREFGTRLDCVAEVRDNGRIRLELRPSVSEIDATRSVMVQNTSIPGLRTRWVDTAVEMDAGQTLVLSGLTQKQLRSEWGSDEGEETALLVTATVDLGEPAVQAEKSPKFQRR